MIYDNLVSWISLVGKLILFCSLIVSSGKAKSYLHSFERNFHSKLKNCTQHKCFFTTKWWVNVVSIKINPVVKIFTGSFLTIVWFQCLNWAKVSECHLIQRASLWNDNSIHYQNASMSTKVFQFPCRQPSSKCLWRQNLHIWVKVNRMSLLAIDHRYQ